MDSKERQQLGEICAELDTIRLGATCAIDGVMPAIRSLLDVENILIYSMTESDGRWDVDRWHHDRISNQMRGALRTLFRSSPQPAGSVVCYDPIRPAVSVRNRVLEANAWIDSEQQGGWEQTRMYREVFVPLRLQHHQQLRVLVCDGPALLGWFGTVHPLPPTPKQHRLLAALVPAMQRRLAIERRMNMAPRLLGALDVALDHLGAPAFIVTSTGAIRETNAAARALLDERRSEISSALCDAIAGRANPLELELIPITSVGAPSGWLAIVRASSVDTRIADAVRTAATRWSLTKRQVEVLGLVVRGTANATIAAQLRIGVRTVELHITALFDRSGVDSRAALVASVLVA